MHRRDEAQRFVVRVRPALRDAASRGCVKTKRVSSSAARQPGRSKTRMVAFGHATEKVAGFLALTHDQRRHLAIIVIHEWWGLKERVKEQAESGGDKPPRPECAPLWHTRQAPSEYSVNAFVGSIRSTILFDIKPKGFDVGDCPSVFRVCAPILPVAASKLAQRNLDATPSVV